MMKHLINRIICLCRGHKWEYSLREYDKYGNLYPVLDKKQCSRCGKIKKETL